MFFPHLVGDACSREPHQLGERVPINAVVLALSAPATTAARACAQGRRAVVRKALGTSKSIPRRRTPLWPSHATSGLDRQRSAPRFHAALRDSELSAAPALGRRTSPGALSTTRQAREQFFRDWPVVSSSQRSSSRSLAWPPVTSQVRGARVAITCFAASP
jgi:hypothetical protein